MSKKMMKCSLALSALMAFVITGSAWAATYNLNGDVEANGAQYFTNGNAGSVDVIGTGKETITFVGGSDKRANVAIGGYRCDSSVSGVKDIVIDGKWLNVFNVNSPNNGEKPDLTINVSGEIRTEDSADVSLFALATGGNVSITAGRITVGSGTISAQSEKGVAGSTTVTATGDLTLSKGTIYAFDTVAGNKGVTSEVVVNANNVNVGGSSYGVMAYTDKWKNEDGSYSYSEGGAKTTVTANQKLSINASYAALMAYDFTGQNDSKKTIDLTAKEILLDSKGYYVAYADSNSEVNINAESSVLNVKCTDQSYGAVAVLANNAKVNLNGDIAIKTEGIYASGINAYGNSVVNLGSTNAIVSFDMIATGEDGDAVAVWGTESSQINVISNELTINTNGAECGSLQVENGSTITVTANKAYVNGVMWAGEDATLDISKIKELTLTGLENNNSIPAIQVAEGGTLKVNTETGTLAIDGAEAGNTYNVVSGNIKAEDLWAKENIAYDRTAMFATTEMGKITYEGEEVDVYKVVYKVAEDLSQAEQEAAAKEYVAATGGEELAVPGLVGSAAGAGSIMEDTAPGAKEFLGDIAADKEMSKETKAAVINSAAQLAEAGGNAGTAVSVAGNVSNVTTGRMSFGGRGHGGHKGGHGVGMFEEGSGAAVWAQYMHGKDDATDMPMDGGATSYESEYDGIVVGVDFKKVGKYHSGIAFNYGEGDSNGFTSAARTKSDYDFWGIGYYGNIRNEDTNFIFDINYAKSDSDVTQNNAGATAAIEASPETATWSAGVKVEKLYQNESVQIIPYTGLRYMSIDTDEYTSKLGGETLFNYAPERQDIWLLPLGVTIKQEVVNDNGWVVTPKVDLSYIWAFGDTDSNMSVSIPGIAASNDTLGFTVMDDGSFLGLVGVEAKMDDWTFGVSYSYQKGDYAESKKWFVDAKYSF